MCLPIASLFSDSDIEWLTSGSKSVKDGLVAFLFSLSSLSSMFVGGIGLDLSSSAGGASELRRRKGICDEV